jgi:predicted nuclease of predicted toxin-antitoxin system
LKLLFDENLSARLVGALADQFPNSSHVNLVGLASATDLEIWAYAREHDFTVISKDDDFRSLSLVNGAPPKVIWLRIGNASTAAIESFIRSALVKIRTFEISAEESLLVLS